MLGIYFHQKILIAFLKSKVNWASPICYLATLLLLLEIVVPGAAPVLHTPVWPSDSCPCTLRAGLPPGPLTRILL